MVNFFDTKIAPDYINIYGRKQSSIHRKTCNTLIIYRSLFSLSQVQKKMSTQKEIITLKGFAGVVC